jgi:hypothetical protein
LCPATDQRGARRSGAAICDIGAMEITPPVLVAGLASADANSANLPFSVDTGVASTTYHLEYGPAGGALAATADVTIPGASDPTDVSVAIGNLTPGTAYQYELVATNMFGTARSGVGLVTTAAAPPATPPKATLGLSGKHGKIKVNKKGKFKIKGATVGCPAGATGDCTATIAVTAKAPKHGKKTLKLGTSKQKIAPGASATIKGKLSKKGTKALGRAKKLKKASIRITVDAPGGEGAAGKVKATLVAAKG